MTTAPYQSMTVGTDGACSGNPGYAGWAWAAADGTWASGAVARSTNQATELQGLLEAITTFADVPELTVELDSAYAMNTYASWMDNHKRRGWHTGDGKPTSNREIIEALVDARDARRAAGLPPVRLVKVKGHARPGTHPLNEQADKQAVAARVRAAAGTITTETGTWAPPGR
ncbi:RNase H family protein [Cellulosimicrobium sp. Marseille-Q4280]|uniref:RNase H family protein n=1 Tax=Cellulosimicrobium sp. Marseille-Q4280 TaxID=2937992 RepID=UPI00203F8306|nr:RNase H family protein [Cellulosimicrobium sp. Marseille-Q4280]